MQIDHLVFAAADLTTGRDWMTDMLGVGPSGAGVHPLMGTHNALWSLGDCYLEVIAVDPEAAPQRARWFGLDDAQVRASLCDGPRLLTWVARVENLAAQLSQTDLPVGESVRVTRTGLHWDLSVRPDGALVEEGRAPTFIEWPVDVVTPERALKASGATLDRLEIAGASRTLRTCVEPVDKVHCAEDGPTLSATFTTAQGARVLTS